MTSSVQYIITNKTNPKKKIITMVSKNLQAKKANLKQ